MKRFMKFSDIISDLVATRMVQPGLIIRCISTDKIMILNKFNIVGDLTEHYGFFTEDRTLEQTVDPNSVWELVNIDLEGDIANEQQ